MSDKRYNIKLTTIILKVQEPESANNNLITTAKKAFKILSAIYEDLDDDQEHFTVLFLDQGNKITGYKTLFSGCQNSSTVDTCILFRTVLLFGASNIIIAHNHPTGILEPSNADLSVTREIKKAGKLLNIKVLDHLILSKKSYYSFKKQNIIL